MVRRLGMALQDPGIGLKAIQQVAGRVPPTGDSSGVMGHTPEFSLGMALPTFNPFYIFNAPWRLSTVSALASSSYLAFGGLPHFRMAS